MQLEPAFEDKLQSALLNDVEQRLVGEFDNVIAGFIEAVHRNLRDYASRHGYDIESTIESLGQPEVTVTDNSVEVVVGWESEQMARWEFGTRDHTIRATNADVLSFVWVADDKRGADPPQWVREEFDQARDPEGQFRSGWRVFLPEVEVQGLPESRAIRDGLNALRRVLEA